MHKKGKIELQALTILNNFPEIEKQPASISGKYHIKETCRQHLELCANVMRHLCDEFNVKDEDRDMLIACAYLHDLGIYVLTLKGKIEHPEWKAFESGYSKARVIMKFHPLISAEILERYNIDRKKEIQRIISTHMSHWYNRCPQPENLYEYMLCVADYVASVGEGILKYEKR